ncbi:helix-turn-helix domain-containing protein [Nakamurella sp.]|uniref:helix-turn-helix domain-containing protein n=1 Tax=Nakamurella sp. TaxID=1869182 RepID=UPI003784ED41
MVDPRLARVIDTRLLTYTVEQAAGLLGVSMGVAYQLVREGVIPAHRIGRRWLISRKALHAWLDNASVG